MVERITIMDPCPISNHCSAGNFDYFSNDSPCCANDWQFRLPSFTSTNDATFAFGCTCSTHISSVKQRTRTRTYYVCTNVAGNQPSNVSSQQCRECMHII